MPDPQPAWPAHLRFLAVEGPIGVGKTSLVKRIAERYGHAMMLEAASENPFLPRFYENSSRWALQTQLHFLCQRSEQLRELSLGHLYDTTVVADYLIDKDPLFARLTLSDDELRLYERVYQALGPMKVTPDLVLVLQAPTERLVERIERRGVAMERGMSTDYLRRLNHAYLDYFHHYDGAPILIVNTEQLNPVDSAEDFEVLLEQLVRFKGRRAFFNQAR